MTVSGDGEARTVCANLGVEHAPLLRVGVVGFHEVFVVCDVPDDVERAVGGVIGGQCSMRSMWSGEGRERYALHNAEKEHVPA